MMYFAQLIVSVLAFIVVAAVTVQSTRSNAAVATTLKLIDEHRGTEMREARTKVFGFGGGLDPGLGFDALSAENKEAAVRLSYYYDHVGLLIVGGLVPPRLIIGAIGGSVMKSWKVLEPYIEAERRKREFLQYQGHFKAFAAMASITEPETTIARSSKWAIRRHRAADAWIRSWDFTCENLWRLATGVTPIFPRFAHKKI